MNLPDFLTLHPFGSVRLAGHRIALEHVIELAQRGDSPERIVDQFPSLPLDLVRRVLEYYEANRKAVDEYVAECRRDWDRRAAESVPGAGVQRVRERLANSASE
jgi:uncharacterized protein (DUF433 family)